jgi:hypothetical protein
MKDNDPLHSYSHVWAWPYVVAGVAFSLVAFFLVYVALGQID